MLETIGVFATVVGVVIAYATLHHQKKAQSSEVRLTSTEREPQAQEPDTVDNTHARKCSVQLTETLRRWKIDYPNKDFIKPSGRNFHPPIFDAGLVSGDQAKEISHKYFDELEGGRIQGVFERVELPLPKSLIWYTLHQTVYFNKIFPSFAEPDFLRPLPPRFGPGQSFRRDETWSEAMKNVKFNILHSNSLDTLTYFIDNTRGHRYPDDRDWYISVKCLPISDMRCQLTIEIFWFDAMHPMEKLLLSKGQLRHASETNSNKFSNIIDSFLGDLSYVALNIDNFGFVPGAHDWLYEPNIKLKLQDRPAMVSYKIPLSETCFPKLGTSIPRDESIGSLEYTASPVTDSSTVGVVDIKMGSSFPNVTPHYLVHCFLKSGDVLQHNTGLGAGRSVVAFSSQLPEGLKKLNPQVDGFFEPYEVFGLRGNDYNLIPPFVSKDQVLGHADKGEPILAPVTGFAKFDMALGPPSSILIRRTE